MKKLNKTKEDLIPCGVAMSGFVSDKSKTIGVLPLKIIVDDQTRVKAFYVVESNVDYNILLGRHGQKCQYTQLMENPLKPTLCKHGFKTTDKNIRQESLGASYRERPKGFGTRGVDRSNKHLLMSDTITREEWVVAMVNLMELLLEYWAEDSLLPNLLINLTEFQHESDDDDVLTIDDLDPAPTEMEDSHPEA
ncbi:hypothetical protein L3X38_015342 [Prunus dulcis]|uniref:Uncharacterized protein n=1 Tax=Prunus dulcis TaxID=3755 RepID=A0AAD4WPX5_PRUDU|nr:hypothetical protein L3X38_015342 [Prunus dulcis]